MTAKSFTRRQPAELKMKHRLVYTTDHPNVFTVIGSNGIDRYRVVLLPRVEGEGHRAFCSCIRGRNEQDCWHARLVIKRRGR